MATASGPSPSSLSSSLSPPSPLAIEYVPYTSERQLPLIQRLIEKDLSEPYSIFTYRYFVNNWPHLTFLAMAKITNTNQPTQTQEDNTAKQKTNNKQKADGETDDKVGEERNSSNTNENSSVSSAAASSSSSSSSVCLGCIICKLEADRDHLLRGYIAMLAVDSSYRHRHIGSSLVSLSISRMVSEGCDLIVLETEVSNKAALGLYERLGFVRDSRLTRYYLNGGDAFRLKRWMTTIDEQQRKQWERERNEQDKRNQARLENGLIA